MFPLWDENPTERKPILTVALIALNIGIYVYMELTGISGQLVYAYGMVPRTIAQGRELHTLITSMFLHQPGYPIHVIGNVWFLWIFGDNIEDFFGRLKFLLIFFASGICASLVHVAFNPSSPAHTIGASGAVAGILGAYIIKYPKAKVDTLLFFFIVKIPSFVFLGVWIFMEVLNASVTTVAGIPVQVAYWAHIGGFFAGALLAFFLEERSGLREWSGIENWRVETHY